MRLFSLALLSVLLAACGPSDRPSVQAGTLIDVVRSAARHDAPISVLNTAVRRKGEAVELRPALDDPDPAVRRAASYVAALWADDASDVAALRPFLTDADPAVRAMIAGSLTGLGDEPARATLQSLHGSTSLMPWSDPSITVGAFADAALDAIDAVGRRR